MAHQTGVRLLIVRADMVFAKVMQDDFQNVFIDFCLNETVRVGNDSMGAPGVKAGDDGAVPVQSNGVLCLVAVMPRILHAIDRFHFFFDISKSSDPLQAVCHLIPFELFLLLVGELLDLAAAALSRHRTGRNDPVRRRLYNLHQTGVSIILLQFHDGDLCFIPDDRIFNEQRKALIFTKAFPFFRKVVDCKQNLLILLQIHTVLLLSYCVFCGISALSPPSGRSLPCHLDDGRLVLRMFVSNSLL